MSSLDVVRALARLGFRKGNSTGSHLHMYRARKDGGNDHTTVVLAKKDIPVGTLKAILRTAKVSTEEFQDALAKHK